MLNIFRRRSYFIAGRVSAAAGIFKSAEAYFAAGSGQKRGELAGLINDFKAGRLKAEKSADQPDSPGVKKACLVFFSELEFALDYLGAAARDFELVGYDSDYFMREMVSALSSGELELSAAAAGGRKAQAHLFAAKRECVRVEQICRHAMAAVRAGEPGSVRLMKRESVYKALCASGDRLDRCADVMFELCQ